MKTTKHSHGDSLWTRFKWSLKGWGWFFWFCLFFGIWAVAQICWDGLF